MPVTNHHVSVIIPTYNRAEYLPRAIKSVLEQTHTNLEVVVVDDGSTDDIKSVVESFNDRRVTYVRQEPRKGASAARNLGVRTARGPYVSFLDSDDEMLPQKIADQLALLTENPHNVTNLGVVIGRTQRRVNAMRAQSQGQELAAHRRPEWAPGSAFSHLFRSGRGTWSTMLTLKKHFEDAGGMDESLPALQWWDLSVRLARTVEFEQTSGPSVVVHRVPGPRVMTPQNRSKAASILIKKYADGIPYRRRFHSSMRRAIGRGHLRAGSSLAALVEFVRAMSLKPNVYTFLEMLMAALGPKLGRRILMNRESRSAASLTAEI